MYGQGDSRAYHNIEGTLLVEGRAGVAIGHNYLHCAGAVDDGPDAALILVPVHAPLQSTESADVAVVNAGCLMHAC